ncbi:MAG TPA: TniB family NTP-binding protein [Mycobacterium sp.]|nr:TniB family NTP-binding protein [Mycobacterium sp.]HPX37864.1 TniB family NTP-binding protein [Mycobacterium sp.]HPZ93330.1 TniB family NTP-binding protein [Mycobacterium sp.]HQC77619.1 TniB family NTP-binding protein [Mycobacterium sp.]HQE14805.1 TniB family NTP-binding protein [Mycobacterium sp.]
MTRTATAAARTSAHLDNLTLSRKEGWREFVTAAPRVQPEQLTRRALGRLSDEARDDYETRRRKWHANIGPIKTPQLAAVHDDLWDIVDSNDQDGDKPKSAVAIDAYPGLGKTTAVLDFAKKFHLRDIRANGEFTDNGDERWPVCRVGLAGNTGMVAFNKAMLAFYAHPGKANGSTADFAYRALDCVLSCHTKLLIIDDLHFLQWRNTAGVAISNHFKYIANEFPVTLIYVGVDLDQRGLFFDGQPHTDRAIAQTARRTTKLTMAPFAVGTERQRRQWHQLLLTLEQRVVLVDKRPGMLATDLSDYLFARSTGHIGSLMTLINRGCLRAIRSGREYLDRDLLDAVKTDTGSDCRRAEFEAAFDSGTLTTDIAPTRQSQRAAPCAPATRDRLAARKRSAAPIRKRAP